MDFDPDLNSHCLLILYKWKSSECLQVIYLLSSHRESQGHSDVKPGSVRDVILTLAESMCT